MAGDTGFTLLIFVWPNVGDRTYQMLQGAGDSDRPSKAFWANDDFECEVIGNVYENRDLIQREAEP